MPEAMGAMLDPNTSLLTGDVDPRGILLVLIVFLVAAAIAAWRN